MLPRTYDAQVCSIARTLELVGERWTLLVIRDAFLGMRRFDEFQESLGIARNVLSDRLRRLVDAGILERVRYQEHPERFEYRLTERGRELNTALIALLRWGDRYLAPDGPPRIVEHARLRRRRRRAARLQRVRQGARLTRDSQPPGAGRPAPGDCRLVHAASSNTGMPSSASSAATRLRLGPPAGRIVATATTAPARRIAAPTSSARW